MSKAKPPRPRRGRWRASCFELGYGMYMVDFSSLETETHLRWCAPGNGGMHGSLAKCLADKLRRYDGVGCAPNDIAITKHPELDWADLHARWQTHRVPRLRLLPECDAPFLYADGVLLLKEDGGISETPPELSNPERDTIRVLQSVALDDEEYAAFALQTFARHVHAEQRFLFFTALSQAPKVPQPWSANARNVMLDMDQSYYTHASARFLSWDDVVGCAANSWKQTAESVVLQKFDDLLSPDERVRVDTHRQQREVNYRQRSEEAEFQTHMRLKAKCEPPPPSDGGPKFAVVTELDRARARAILSKRRS